MSKKLLLHFNFLKKSLSGNPKTIKDVYEEMEKEFGVNYQYVYREIQELIKLNKINIVRHVGQDMLLWSKAPVQFEYELSHNVVKIEKQYVEFHTVPSKVRQMKLPVYVLSAIQEKLYESLDQQLELIVEVKAIKSNQKWYKIQKEA